MVRLLIIGITALSCVVACSTDSRSFQKRIFINEHGVPSVSGDTIFASPLLILKKSDGISDEPLYEVLLPNRRTATVNIDTARCSQVIVENDSVTAFAIHPDSEAFYEYPDSLLVLHHEMRITGTSSRKEPLSHTEMMLVGEDRYYPFMALTDNRSTGYINAGEMKIGIRKDSGSQKISERFGYNGLIRAPFINSTIESWGRNAAENIRYRYRYGNDTLIRTDDSSTVSSVDAVITFSSEAADPSTTLYSVNGNRTWLLEFHHDTVISIAFDTDYVSMITRCEKADVDGNGANELVVEVGYIYGDGTFIDLFIIPDSFEKETFKLHSVNFSGNSGEGDLKEPPADKWYLKKGELRDTIVFCKKENGKVVREWAVDIGIGKSLNLKME